MSLYMFSLPFSQCDRVSLNLGSVDIHSIYDEGAEQENNTKEYCQRNQCHLHFRILLIHNLNDAST